MTATSPARSTLAACVTALAAILTGCGSGGGGISVQPQPTVTSVSVTPSTSTINVGSTAALTASVIVSGGASNAVTWSSSSSAIASVAGAGTSATVTGASAGTATITATSVADGSKSGSASVTVNPNVATVTVSGPATSVRIGSTLQLTATARDAAGNVVVAAVTWSSSAVAVAAVSGSGLVTGVAIGTANITARVGTITSSNFAVTVIPLSTVSAWAASRAIPSTYLSSSGSLWDIWSPGTSPVYAALSDGIIGRWDGSGWTVSDQNAAGIFGLSGSGASDVYAVGSGGAIRRFNGASWATMTSGTTSTLYDVWISSANNGFAVGSGGTILRLIAGVWSTMASGTTQTLWSVWGSSATNVFAVGEGGTILRFTGAAWAAVPSGTTNALYGVWGNSATFAVVVGSTGTIRTWNGATWNAAASGTTNALYAVSGDAVTGTIATVGETSTVLMSTAATATTTWTASPPGFIADDYNAVWRNDGVGVFVGLGAGLGGVLRRSTAGAWTISTLAPNLNAALVVSASSAHVAGSYGAYAQLVNNAWQSQFGAGGAYVYFNQLYAASATQIFGARFSGAFTLNAGNWVSSFEPGGSSFTSIGGTGASDVYLSGASGLLYRYNGTTWSSVTTSGLSAAERVWHLHGLQGSSTGPVFAVGFDGTTGSAGFILRLLNGAWSRMTIPTTTALWAVYVLDAATAFAVGNAGTILRYNGTTWTQMTSGTSVQLRGVWAASATEVYVVGAGGTILRYDGTSWTPMTSGTTVSLFDVHGIAGVMAVAVGEGMTVVRGTSTAAAIAIAPTRVRATGLPSAASVLGSGDPSLRLSASAIRNRR